MIDMDVVGLISPRTQEGGQPFDLTQADNVTSFILAAQRRDTEQERRQKLATGQTVFNYGLHFTYRNQRFDSVNTLSQPWDANGAEGVGVGLAGSSPVVMRQGDLFIPDLWARVERKEFRIEAEFAAVLGSIKGRQFDVNGDGVDHTLEVYQFGAVLQGEGRFLNGDLEVGGEVGFASGDKAAGMGNYPRRNGGGRDYTVLGDTDGSQFKCETSGCSDPNINNFRFNRDYRVDMILYREILGGVTDSIYFKLRGKYRITQGLEIFASGLYSRVLFPQSAPGSLYTDSNESLGVELNAGVRYETEDGFFGQLQYGILFPLEGFMLKTDPYVAGQNTQLGGSRVTLDNPQALRAVFGIRF